MGWIPLPASAVLLLGSIYVIERRGKKEPVSPRRQLDLSTVLESIPEPAWIISAERNVVDANSAAAGIVGKERQDLVGRHWDPIEKLISGNSRGRETKSVYERAVSGEAVRSERRLVRVGRRGGLDLLISATPMRNEQGEVIAVLFIARDVTELSALQRHMGEVERHLAIGQMAAALAHDFNNILTAIGQAAYLLQHGKELGAEERRDYVGMIQTAVQRGAELIRGVREYIRTGSGALQAIDVRRILQEAVELTRPLADKAKIVVRTELRPIPHAYGNAADLRRVFTNIIINGIEAMSSGGQMTVGCCRENDRITVTIADTGDGIAPENREKIFHPYFTTKQKGTGLGLSGAQKILRAEGGDISFRTEPGKGTTFIVTLALADSKRDTKPQRCEHRPAA